MLNFLPSSLQNVLKYVNQNLLYEIRLRTGQPIKVNYEGKYLYLTKFGVRESAEHSLVCHKEDIDELISKACKNSVYAVNEELKQGFITVEGVRIGVGGTFVTECDRVLSVRDFTSLCIRIPHEVEGCSSLLRRICFLDLSSVLIMSAPGMGKTTFLKDILRTLSKDNNVFVADERGELSIENCQADAIRFAPKEIAFKSGLRALRPDYIITDELEEKDYSLIKRMINGGVKVVASAHLTQMQDPIKNIFDYYAILSSEHIGQVKCVFDKSGELIYG